MEARFCRTALLAAVLSSLGASQRTTNFIVSAPTAQLAAEIAQAAEDYRRELAIEWIGQELPRWFQPCPITVNVGPHLGAGGATSFMFEQGRPFGWQMTIQGSRERLLDSVLPHEVTHTIFASYFGRPLPRWADEGACTTVEHESERAKQHQLLNQFLTTKPSRGIPFNRMFAMKEYPPDIMPLYSQGYSLVRFLLLKGGKRSFIEYLADGMRRENWDEVTRQHYGYRDLSDLQVTWVDWVRQGSPSAPQLAASAQQQDERLAQNDPSFGARLVPVRGTPGQTLKSTPPLANRNNNILVARGQNAPSKRSWYARQRDRAGQPTDLVVATAVPSGDPFQGRVASSSQPSHVSKGISPRSLSRPQVPQRTSETVLEWDRAQENHLPRGSLPFVPRVDAPLSAGGTVWR